MIMKTLNGWALRNALIAGTENLIRERAAINAINVFPVPDADTGTNMAETMRSIAGAVITVEQNDISLTLQRAADSALTGAKGNSGAILAQFFTGLADELSKHVKVTVEVFATAVEKAVTASYRAVSDPKEGTILSVLKAWSAEVSLLCNKTEDFFELHKGALVSAKKALKKTTRQLAQLRRANVVDAGAQGFISILEGIEDFIRSGRFRRREKGLGEFNRDAPAAHESAVTENLHTEEEAGKYRYCTEILLDQCSKSPSRLKELIAELGDSLIAAGNSKRCKIHIHTDSPAEVISRLGRQGDVTQTKVDDMKRQMALSRPGKAKCSIIVDSACDLSVEELDRLGIQMISAQIQLGSRSFRDKLEMTAPMLFRQLEADRDSFAATSQPPAADFDRAFGLSGTHYNDIIYIGVSGSTSGTLQAGRNAARRLKEASVEVVNAKLGSAGIGIIAKQVAEYAAKGKSAKEVSAFTADCVEKVKLFVSVPDISYLVRGGRVSAGKGRILNALKIRPIVSRTKSGDVGIAGIFAGEKKALPAVLKKYRKALKGTAPGREEFLIAHADAPDEAAKMKRMIETEFKPEKPVLMTEMGAALALHAGPGAIAVASLPVNMEE